MKLRERAQVGLDFYEFLKETNRSSITDRSQLTDVYNGEFRRRSPGSKDPNFGSVLFSLRSNGKITMRGRNIHFNTKVRALYVDQWTTSRTRRRASGGGASGGGASGGGASGGGASEAPPTSVCADEAETGVRARRKMASDLMKTLKTNRKGLTSDKHGVCITSDGQLDNGKISLCLENTQQHTLTLRIRNSGGADVDFTYFSPLTWLRFITLTDQHKVTRNNPLTLRPGDSYDVSVHFQCSWVGFYPVTLVFEFRADPAPPAPSRADPAPDPAPPARFHIVRFIEAQCLTALGLELAPVAPYRPQPLTARPPQPHCPIVDGQQPDGLSVVQLKNVVQLKGFLVPAYVSELVQSLQAGLRTHRQGVLESPLTWENYSTKFQLLLFLEELQMEADLTRYNIPNTVRPEPATMTRDPADRKLLLLEVPGVSENRPSVLRGDQLLVQVSGETRLKYRGYVHQVELNNLKLGFSSELLNQFFDGLRFSVDFVLNRLMLRLQHRVLDLVRVHGLGPVLFPTADPQPGPELPDLRLFDQKLERNPEQLAAVQHILAGSSRPAPYLVFGPPGTGKTVTLVEAIKQVEKVEPSCRLLVCAPSNSAADLLCSKILQHVDSFKVFRMYASSREPRAVPEELKACSNLEGSCYVFPPKEKLMEFRVVVTTLITAGRLVTGGLPSAHYTHVFVDEAGHALETECLIPVAGLLSPDSGQLVLAGDPKQLGPVLRSPFAVKYGLGVSLLERLMNHCSLYQRHDDKFDARYVTKLLCNYRSHPEILTVPNQLFYDGELKFAADEMMRNSYCSWTHLPQQGFPLIFHSVLGLDERESSSPSFFNRSEVELLVLWVEKLLQTGGKRGVASVTPGDIGIIAPYRKQVQKIRQALDKVGKKLKVKNLKQLKVGSVEEFQGQERRVVLVSTVRSSAAYSDFDAHFSLGFVKNHKRFNVAVTRAKALLIVVGNPRVLSTDPTWARFITHCSDRGGFDGVRLSDIQQEDEEQVVTRLAALYINMQGQVSSTESVVQQHEDPEWRGDI